MKETYFRNARVLFHLAFGETSTYDLVIFYVEECIWILIFSASDVKAFILRDSGDL